MNKRPENSWLFSPSSTPLFYACKWKIVGGVLRGEGILPAGGCSSGSLVSSSKLSPYSSLAGAAAAAAAR